MRFGALLERTIVYAPNCLQGASTTAATLTMLVPIRSTFWLERRLDWREALSEPRQHLLQHVIAPHPQFAADDLNLGMAIAEMATPGPP